MQKLKLIWVSAALVMLVLGVAGALAGMFSSDVGPAPLWFAALGLLAFPLGLVGFVAFTLLLRLLESWLWGPETHFSELAFVCLSWSVVVGCGLAQAKIFRSVSSFFRARRPLTKQMLPVANVPVQAKLLVELPADRYRLLSTQERPPRVGDVLVLDQGFTSADGLPMVIAYFPTEGSDCLYEARVYESELA